MPLFYQSPPITATTKSPVQYHFVKAELAEGPYGLAEQCVRLDFLEDSTVQSPCAFSTRGDGALGGYLQTVEDKRAGSFAVYIPVDYSTVPAAMPVRIFTGDSQEDWVVKNLPPREQPAPAFLESKSIAPGVTVAGTASDLFGAILQARLQVVGLKDPSDWYFEAAVQPPYAASPEEARLNDWSAVAGGEFPFLQSHGPFTSYLDRVAVTGAMEHFVRLKESVKCELATGKDSVGRTKLLEPVVVTTESGFRFRIEQSDDNYDRDPKNKDEVRFMVEFDNSTMQNGLDQAPDRLDLWFSPPQHGVGFSPGLSVPLVVRHEQSAIWTLPKDQVKPVIDMQITVARRYADHKLPFSLILPLKHEDSAPSIQTSPNAP